VPVPVKGQLHGDFGEDMLRKTREIGTLFKK
jgi:hypothetical protein